MCVRALLKRNARTECMYGPNVSVLQQQQQQQRIIEIHNFENTEWKERRKTERETKFL